MHFFLGPLRVNIICDVYVCITRILQKAVTHLHSVKVIGTYNLGQGHKIINFIVPKLFEQLQLNSIKNTEIVSN